MMFYSPCRAWRVCAGHMTTEILVSLPNKGVTAPLGAVACVSAVGNAGIQQTYCIQKREGYRKVSLLLKLLQYIPGLQDEVGYCRTESLSQKGRGEMLCVGRA